MVTSAKTSFHWEKVLLEVNTVEVFSFRLAINRNKEICALDVHREIADLVNDEHGKNFELIQQTVLKVGLLELFNELVAIDVVGGETVLCRHQAQGGGQMGLAHAGRTSSEEIPRSPRLRRGLRPLYSFFLSPRDPLRWARVRLDIAAYAALWLNI